MKTTIIIRTSFFAYHRWPKAPDEVKFLREYHPHDFKVEAEIEVLNDDRELEFFIVRKEVDSFIKLNFTSTFEYSCEQIARAIRNKLQVKYGYERDYTITVSEDGLNAGRVYYIGTGGMY